MPDKQAASRLWTSYVQLIPQLTTNAQYGACSMYGKGRVQAKLSFGLYMGEG